MHPNSIGLSEQRKRAFFSQRSVDHEPNSASDLEMDRMIAGNGTGLASGIWQRTLEFLIHGGSWVFRKQKEGTYYVKQTRHFENGSGIGRCGSAFVAWL
jgi:hypothetical protein